MKDKITQNYKQSRKYSHEIREMFQGYLDGKFSFGVVLNRLLSRKIIYINLKEAKEDD